MKAVILARVSKEDQLEGASIPAQLARSQEYAKRKELEIFKEYQFDESSLKEHRVKFEEVLKDIRASKEPIALVVETVDRLQRSFKESVVLDEFRKSGKLEIHFIRENLVLHKNSNSSELQRWDLGVFVARSYVLQLSDNVKRSLEQRVRSGEFPHKAPLGYKNITLDNGKKDIVPDPNKDFLIVKMFELYASGNFSMLKLTKEMKRLGLTSSVGKAIVTSQVEHILKNPFYYGEMFYKEKLFQHRYAPLISRYLFNQAQEVMASFSKKPFKRSEKPYIFRGLISCPDCGCLFSPELKKGKYIYYHCTNYHRNCTNRAWVKESRIAEQVEGILKQFQLTDEQAEFLKERLRLSHENEQSYYQQNLKRIQGRLDAISRRLRLMYEDRLDGRISTDEYDGFVKELGAERQRLLIELEEHAKGDDSFYQTASKLLDLASRAYELFKSSEVSEKTSIVSFVLQNLRLQGENLLYEAKTPFQGVLAYHETQDWLAWRDSFRTFEWERAIPSPEVLIAQIRQIKKPQLSL